jgi:hypothetical protein
MADLRVSLLVLAACGAHHADLPKLATSTYCSRHDCTKSPKLVDLRAGCFAVEHGPVYQCDDAVADPPQCFEVPPCAEQCETTVRVAERGVIALDPCRDRAGARHGTPLTCDPVHVRVAGDLDGLAIALANQQLAVPAALVLAMERSGKDKILYEAAVCVAGGEVTVEQQSTRAEPAIASWLHDFLAHQPLLHATFDAHCNDVTLILSHFECHFPQRAL